jgi:hypothetical protein
MLGMATKGDFYVSPRGRDSWSGTRPEPRADGSDGPFATLARAQKAVRAACALEPRPVTVLIRGGRYELRRPIVFRPVDSGTAEAPVIYAAYGDEQPVFSGGRAITGFTEGQDGLWTADVAVGAPASSRPAFNQLFINGERRQRARHPNTGYLRTAGLPPGLKDPHAARGDKEAGRTIAFRPGDIQRFRNLEDVNILLYHAWTASLHWIHDLDMRRHTVTFTAAAHWPTGYWEHEQRYVIENCLEALDTPGEWYLDRKQGRLYVMPLPGENLNEAEVIAPALQQLLIFRGNPAKEQYVQHIHLEGLSFQHADWHVPNKGAADGQAAVWLSGAVFGRGMLSCSLEDCEIAHVGQYGVWLERGCRDNLIRQCEIHDLGAGGVKVGETCSVDQAKLATAHNTVDNCFIHDGGHVFPAGVGVLVLRSSSNTVTHNEISHLYYTGVSVGWSWGYAPCTASQNLIEYNHIHHIGQGVLSDMGGIYTLGISPGTRLRYNLIHEVESYSYGSWGIYPDEGSTHLLIENNICYHCKTGGFHQHYGRENDVQNNIFASATLMQVSRTREEAHSSFDFEHNIVYCTNPQVLGGNWSNNNYRLERNVYWNANGPELQFAGMDFRQWQAEGRDLQSIVADPLFEDPEHGDFRLKKESPALRLGFHPIKTDKIGLYGAKEWVEKANKM